MHLPIFKKILKQYISWERHYEDRIRYGTTSRLPFFELACEFIPEKEDPIIVDVGAGDGSFAVLVNDCLGSHPFLLDANEATVKLLKRHFSNVILYRAPDPLPFRSSSVDFIHCSHLIEHLAPDQFYSLLCEFDRVLKQNGVICISAPLLWRNFYYDLSHVKPYYPEVIIKYMCSSDSKNYTRPPIKGLYEVVKLVYRYDIKAPSIHEGIGSTCKLIDLFLQAIKKILVISGCCYFSKNGYTLVLQKMGQRWN